jgi:hypothetical protein
MDRTISGLGCWRGGGPGLDPGMVGAASGIREVEKLGVVRGGELRGFLRRWRGRPGDGCLLQWWNKSGFGDPVGLRHHLISGTTDIRSKRLQLLEDLSLVHDR